MYTRQNSFRRLVLSAALFLGLGASFSRAQPANDMFASRTVLGGTNIVVTSSNIGATRESGEPYHAGNSGGASVWWTWRAPRSDVVTISTSGSSFDTVLGVYTGGLVSGLTTIASNDDDPEAGDLTSKIVFNAVANQTYQIAVDGYGGVSGSIRLSVIVGPPPPLPPAPSWALPDLHGAMIYSTNFAGKVVILDFWATWCSPCKAEMPDLVALQDTYRADGLVVVGADVSWSGETAATVLGFLATWTPLVNYQVVMSNAGTEAPFGGIAAIPTTFIIDRQNLLRQKYVGTQPRSTLEQQIIPLLYSNSRMTCQRSGNQMTLSWPTNAPTVTFALEWATTLSNPSWTAWPILPTVLNGSNIVQVPSSGAPRFFRLHMVY